MSEQELINSFVEHLDDETKERFKGCWGKTFMFKDGIVYLLIETSTLSEFEFFTSPNKLKCLLSCISRCNSGKSKIEIVVDFCLDSRVPVFSLPLVVENYTPEYRTIKARNYKQVEEDFVDRSEETADEMADEMYSICSGS